MTQGRGFSLVEMVAGISLMAILASITVPPLQSLLHQNRLTTGINLLLSHIQLARSRAVMDAETVVICPSADGASCVRDRQGWAQGWLVFIDENYRYLPQLEPEDSLLLAHQNEDPSLSVKTTLFYLRYNPLGYARNGTLTLCNSERRDIARAIIISITGRARVSKTAADGSDLICP